MGSFHIPFTIAKSYFVKLASKTLKLCYHNKPPEPVYAQHAFIGDRFSDIELLLGCKTGLFQLKNGSLVKLFGGRVYGITKVADRWYATVNRKISFRKKIVISQGYLISFLLDGGRLRSLRVEYCPLDTSVHQIDHWGSWLIVTDTANNRILRFEIEDGELNVPDAFYPNGVLENGRESQNYAHINSVYCNGINVFVLYHNDSTNSGRSSQIAKLDMAMKVVEVEEIDAQCSHNVVWDNGELFFCDSANGRFRNRARVLLDRPVYLRGLARAKNYWVVGGSDFSTKSARSFSTGYLFQVSDSGEVLSELRMPATGSVYEVRLLNERDFCLSQFATSQGNAPIR